MHSVFWPHGLLWQGLTHFWFIQALWGLHSELTIHSGLQFGGDPMKFVKHEHTGWLFTSLQTAFNPQGDGLHGFNCKISFSKNKTITF